MLLCCARTRLSLMQKWIPGQNKVGQNFSRTKLFVGKILVTSKDFSHFCPTNNFVYFEISVRGKSVQSIETRC